MGIGTLEFPSTIIIACSIFLLLFATAQENTQFIFNGFKGSINNLHVDGLAKIHKNGLLQLTDFTMVKTSHVFYKNPVTFGRNHLSFSTTFVFAMHPQITNHSGNGIAFVICPSLNLHSITTGQLYLGLFNTSSNGLKSNHVFAVELDTIQNEVFHDIDDNHVGIDVDSLVSDYAASASYYSDKERVWKTLRLASGKPMQVWIDYDGIEKMINVTISPIDELKPSKPLLSKHLDLSNILVNSMYVGFSAATGLVSNYHSILGWSWNQSGPAQNLDISKLPSLPKFRKHWSRLNRVFVFVMLSILSLVVLMIGGVTWIIRRKKYDELEEPWEQIYRPHRHSYKDLFTATKGFKDTELLGVGGFGKVYKGELGSTGVKIAVKRVSHDSRQGMREFVAEVASMRRLTHRNLVQLLGYCRRKGELLLVYEYMINGSLDKLLFTKDDKSELCWFLRFKIIRGIASALLYLHEEWEQTIIHRDVKASNVLLDAEMNARLGDFGLARLYDHNTDPRTTHLVGTIGYIAPEANRTRVPSTKTDIFAFGMFLFEVGCGRRPIDPQAEEAEDVILVDWVYDWWKKGAILKASDPKLKEDYDKSEMEVVLKLGLLCSNPKAEERPTMRQVVQYLHYGHMMPDIPSDYNPKGNEFFVEGFGSSSFQTIASETVSELFLVYDYMLLGYCRRKGELFLVYDYMLNSSLDKYLYDGKPNLSWPERFKIIKGLASALVYLHEEWEQVVVHRDVKPSNVLLDANMNARLGDFGLARLYDHGKNPHKTHVVGTIGYLAPELIRSGKATPTTDVFSFGMTVLEIVCGRNPLNIVGEQEYNLSDWVYDCWIRGAVNEASDPRLGGNYVSEEMELVLNVGMMCSNPRPETRPSMRQVIQFLNEETTLQGKIPYDASISGDYTLPSSSEGMSTSYSADSVLLFGR